MRKYIFLVLLLKTSLFNSALARDNNDNDSNKNEICVIKGNISVKTGEKIYHVPGQKYYNATKIRPEYGERWFCTEQEAKNAGWRKSKI